MALNKIMNSKFVAWPFVATDSGGGAAVRLLLHTHAANPSENCSLCLLAPSSK